jgi:hypothetical protein
MSPHHAPVPGRTVGQFVSVTHDALIDHRGSGGGLYRVLLAGGRNVYGLIGFDLNGIAILDEVQRVVRCSELGRDITGYNGPTQAQIEMWAAIVRMPRAQLEGLLATCGRN